MAGRSGTPDRSAWHEQTVEAILEPALEIVDSHHHLWDDREPPYALDQLLADTGSGHNVVQTVFVEAGWGWTSADTGHLVAVPEMRRAAAAAEQSRDRGGATIAGLVGYADLLYGDRCAETFDKLREASGGLLVGVRDRTAYEADPAFPRPTTGTRPGITREGAWRAGFALLARYGLTYDAWFYHPQLADVAELADAFPGTVIIVDHLGAPLGAGEYAHHQAEVFADWSAGIGELARRPNVTIKLGGMGMPILAGSAHRDARPPSSAELAGAWRPYFHRCIDAFGTDRCMFESNFPPDRMSVSYPVLWNTFKRLADGASPDDKAALFAGTARSVYGLAAP